MEEEREVRRKEREERKRMVAEGETATQESSKAEAHMLV